MVDIEGLYKKYGAMVYRRCFSMLRNSDDAMDATQEVFVHALRSSDTLHDRFPSSLLWRMATNECLNRIRAFRAVAGSEALEEAADPLGERDYAVCEDRLFLEELLCEETSESRSLLYMYHIDGMSLAEIGEALCLSASGVRKRLLTIKKRVREKGI